MSDRRVRRVLATGSVGNLPVEILRMIWKQVYKLEAAMRIQRLFRAMRARDTLLSSWVAPQHTIQSIVRNFWIARRGRGFMERQRRRRERREREEVAAFRNYVNIFLTQGWQAAAAYDQMYHS